MIFILLATHNGARFLPDLLTSVVRQSVHDWRMLVRDDGSSDDSLEIVSRLARNDDRLALVRDDRGRLGAAMNFGMLMQQAQELGARYVLLADQDDVWLPDKLEQSLRLIERAETVAGVNTPLLVHADLAVVDERLSEIHPSMTTYAGVNRHPRDPLRTLLVYNFVTGCTAMFNRPLLEAALPVPQSAVMHDWWLALCAAALGQIWHVPKPLALYRQHPGNAVGVRSYGQIFLPWSPYWMQRWQRAGDELAGSVEQARALCRHLQSRSAEDSGPALRLVEDYCRLFTPPATSWQRYRGLRKLGIGPRDVARQLTLAARVWRFPPAALHTPLAEWNDAA